MQILAVQDQTIEFQVFEFTKIPFLIQVILLLFHYSSCKISQI